MKQEFDDLIERYNILKNNILDSVYNDTLTDDIIEDYKDVKTRYNKIKELLKSKHILDESLSETITRFIDEYNNKDNNNDIGKDEDNDHFTEFELIALQILKKPIEKYQYDPTYQAELHSVIKKKFNNIEFIYDNEDQYTFEDYHISDGKSLYQTLEELSNNQSVVIILNLDGSITHNNIIRLAVM